MRKLLVSAFIGVTATTGLLVFAGASRAQDIFITPPVPPPPPPPFIDANNNGPGLGNKIFDRWIDNRRGVRSSPSGGYVPRTVYAPAPDNLVRIHITVPADAKVWIDDQETKQTGPVRHF